MLNNISKHIIKQLQKNKHHPYTTINKTINLSKTTIHQRIQQLLNTNIIQIITITNPLQINFNHQTIINIHTKNNLTSITNQLTKIPKINYIIITTNNFDLLAKTVYKNNNTLLELINTHIHTIPNIHTTKTFIYLKLRKQLYN